MEELCKSVAAVERLSADMSIMAILLTPSRRSCRATDSPIPDADPGGM